VSPIKVTVQNYSGRPVRISPSMVKLTLPTGFEVAALPAEKEAARAAIYQQGYAYYGYLGFATDPYLAPGYYGDEYIPLGDPTLARKILARSLPDGVLANRGMVSGFVYFPSFKSPVPDVMLSVQVEDSATHRRIATVRIPLTIRD
jgi:hypothetical protein